jgi:hypothetical protein
MGGGVVITSTSMIGLVLVYPLSLALDVFTR